MRVCETVWSGIAGMRVYVWDSLELVWGSECVCVGQLGVDLGD